MASAIPDYLTSRQLDAIRNGGCAVGLADADGNVIDGVEPLPVDGSNIAASATLAVITQALHFAAPEREPVLAVSAVIFSAKGQPLARAGSLGVKIGEGNWFDIPACSLNLAVR